MRDERPEPRPSGDPSPGLLPPEPGQKLIVFVRAPLPGEVKRRLAATIGTKKALAAYRFMVERLLGTVAALPQVELHYAPADAIASVRPWLRPGWTFRPQRGEDLGARMQAAFAQAFLEGGSRVVLIGSDCPEVTRDDIARAWAGLASCDVVLGPARDGGYWLIGLRQPQPSLFEGMRWSHGEVLAETVLRARRAHLQVSWLRELSDIDTEQDWREFIRSQGREV